VRNASSAPEALIAALARTGDRDAFAELVRRRQSWLRNLMRRCCGHPDLADDLAQQAFLQAWRDIGKLRDPKRFGAWLKQLAINVWRQHLRSNDPTRNAAEHDDSSAPAAPTRPGIAMDLDRALAELPANERLCVVLSYHEGMTHAEIAAATDLPLGTVKSHVRRGAQRLQQLLGAYQSGGAK
jgi:RNA polymerase sigma-70 factor, ECF subfamily